MDKKRRARRYGTAHWPDLEIKLKNWVLNKRKEGKKVSTIAIILKAKEVAEEEKIENFASTSSWCYRGVFDFTEKN